MKKVFPIALFLCLLFSFSGLNAANHISKTSVKTSKFWWQSYETYGTLTNTPYGTIEWYLTYQGRDAFEISFSNNGNWFGPHYFQVSGSVATTEGPRPLGILQVQVSWGDPVFTTWW